MNRNLITRAIWLCLVVLVPIALGSCGGGGGGGGGGNLPPSGTSNWDQMVWDQDNWG